MLDRHQKWERKEILPSRQAAKDVGDGCLWRRNVPQETPSESSGKARKKLLLECEAAHKVWSTTVRQP